MANEFSWLQLEENGLRSRKVSEIINCHACNIGSVSAAADVSQVHLFLVANAYCINFTIVMKVRQRSFGRSNFGLEKNKYKNICANLKFLLFSCSQTS